MKANPDTEILLGKTDSDSGAAAVTLEVLNFLKTRLLITANSGGGKSWLIRRIAELLCGIMPVIIIDPEGEFKTLREKFDFVLIGPDGEAPADCRSAKFTMLKMLELRTSAIFDLSELAPHEKHRFVRLISEAAIDSPKELWRDTTFIFDEAHTFCMDTRTEILTQAGWKKHNEVFPGMVAVAFDPTQNNYSLQAISRVIHRNYEGEMIRLKSDGLDSFTTPEHRSVIQRTQRAKGRTGIKYPWTFCEAGKVPTQVNIPIGGAPYGNGSNLTDEGLQIIGWLITDGCFTGGKSKKYLSISQSVSTVKRGVFIAQKMEEVLSQYKGVTVYNRPMRRNAGKITKPSKDFYLGKRLSEQILKHTQGNIHRVPRLLIESCTKRQLGILFNALMEGDGSANKVGDWITFYPGNCEGLADDLQEICIRLGISATKKFVPQTQQWTVLISRRKHHTSRKPKREQFSGTVWDITIPGGAFIARRNGKVFVTGNCPENGKGQSEARAAVLGFPTKGRKRHFGCIFATQRLAKLAMDARAEMLNRIVGMMFEPDDIQAAAGILGIGGKDERKDFARNMRTMPEGMFYAFGRAIGKETVLFKSGPVQTSHEVQTALHGVKAPPPPSKIKKLLPQLADLPQQAEDEARTMDEAREKIQTLKAELVEARRQQPKTETKLQTVKERMLTPAESKRLTRLAGELADLTAKIASLPGALDKLSAIGQGLKDQTALLTKAITPDASQAPATGFKNIPAVVSGFVPAKPPT